VFEKMQADYQRFLELEAALQDPALATDVARVTTLAKERGPLAKVALPTAATWSWGRQIAEAEALPGRETDSEMRAYAEAELEALRPGRPRPARRCAT
jgi:peptide chain release factor 1